MSPCRSGAGEPEGPLLKGVGGLRRGSPLGYSSSPSQGKDWELVTTQELLAQECWSSPHGQTLESYWPGHVLPGWGEVTTGSDSCLVVLGDQAPSVLFQEGKEQWGLELWKRARDLAPYRWSSPGLTLSTEAAQNLWPRRSTLCTSSNSMEIFSKAVFTVWLSLFQSQVLGSVDLETYHLLSLIFLLTSGYFFMVCLQI